MASYVVYHMSGGYRGVAMVSAETPSENSACPKFIDESSCGRDKLYIVCYSRTFYWQNFIILPLKLQL